MRVLIAEDYPAQRAPIVRGLQHAGFIVDWAADGEQAHWQASHHPYDALVLDLMLPKLDGLTVLTRLREEGHQLPVLILSARDTVADRVEGLNAGADDYLTKPFAFDELLARLHALVRRKYGSEKTTIEVGDLCIDPARREASRGGTRIELTRREYALLEYLGRRAGEVVSRAEIWDHVYELNASASSNVVDVYIAYLRKKLDVDGRPRLIHTRRGHGYVLEATS